MSKMADVSVISLRSTVFNASSAVRIGAAMDPNTRNTVDVHKQCTIKNTYSCAHQILQVIDKGDAWLRLSQKP